MCRSDEKYIVTWEKHTSNPDSVNGMESCVSIHTLLSEAGKQMYDKCMDRYCYKVKLSQIMETELDWE